MKGGIPHLAERNGHVLLNLALHYVPHATAQILQAICAPRSEYECLADVAGMNLTH
jgi:hypothetical protein